MICRKCQHAADQQLPRAEHCTTAGGPGSPCDCAHRVDSYRKPTTKEQPASE